MHEERRGKVKKGFQVVVTVISLVMLLKWLNIFQESNGLGRPAVMIFLIVLFSAMLFLVETRMDHNHQIGKQNLENLDCVKYLFSIVIILLHLRPFPGISDKLDLAFNNIASRICVPFFFLINGFFVARKESGNPSYIKKYVESMLPLYLLWSAIYVPVLLSAAASYLPAAAVYLNSLNIPWYGWIPLVLAAIPAAIAVALVYAGTYYHLWYFPALFFSLITLGKWKKKFPIKYLLILSFFFLLFGATETYYGILPPDMQKILHYYYQLFFTTRNFLFFGLFYVVLGYTIGKRKDPYRKDSFLKFTVCIFLLVAEGLILQGTQRLNSNILLACVPLVYYLFLSLLYLDKLWLLPFRASLRGWSKYYYLIHPAVILFFQLLEWNHLAQLSVSWKILLILLTTHVLSLLLLRIKRRVPQLSI